MNMISIIELKNRLNDSLRDVKHAQRFRQLDEIQRSQLLTLEYEAKIILTGHNPHKIEAAIHLIDEVLTGVK